MTNGKLAVTPGLITLVVGALLMLPLFVESTYALHVMILIFISVITGSSWNILGGYAGQYSVGHAAYFGVGAYTTMMLLQFRHIPPWYGVWVGVAAALVIALIIGSILGVSSSIEYRNDPGLCSSASKFRTWSFSMRKTL